MEDLKEEIAVEDGRMDGSLDLREVTRGFASHVLPLTIPVVIDDFEHFTRGFIFRVLPLTISVMDAMY